MGQGLLHGSRALDEQLRIREFNLLLGPTNLVPLSSATIGFAASEGRAGFVSYARTIEIRVNQFDHTIVQGSRNSIHVTVREPYVGSWLVRSAASSVVPEPASFAIWLIAGTAGFVPRRRRRC